MEDDYMSYVWMISEARIKDLRTRLQMKYRPFLRKGLALFLFLSIGGCDADTKEEKAVSLYKIEKTCESISASGIQLKSQGRSEDARALFLEGVSKGCADSYYQLTYRFVLPLEQRVAYLVESAKLGHSKALKGLFDQLFLRRNSIAPSLVELSSLLDIYRHALKENPSVEFYGRLNAVAALEMCVEAPDFDIRQLNQTVVSQVIQSESLYSVWQLAESLDNSKLNDDDYDLSLIRFQLVCRGGDVPSELESAVEDIYPRWKNGRFEDFNLCNYVTSGMGGGFCASREADSKNSEIQNQYDQFLKGMAPEVIELFHNAINGYRDYLELKVYNEEGHGGTGRAAWAIDSKTEQIEEYFQTIVKIRDGFIPTDSVQESNIDDELSNVYEAVLEKLGQKPIGDLMMYEITADGVSETQQQWISSRESSQKLFEKLNESVPPGYWYVWITEARVKELNTILTRER